MPRVFIYIISTVAAGYRLTGSVPAVCGGRVFFGPCKRTMRPKIKKGDYILGISGSAAGSPRRVLLFLKATKPIRFAEAYQRGKDDPDLKRMRGHAVHVRPKNLLASTPQGKYEHIPGAPHKEDWVSDVKGSRDAFIIGTAGSWVAGENAPEITDGMIELWRHAITWRGVLTIRNPLTNNAIGRYIELCGEPAAKLLKMVRKPSITIQDAVGKRRCIASCKCR